MAACEQRSTWQCSSIKRRADPFLSAEPRIPIYLPGNAHTTIYWSQDSFICWIFLIIEKLCLAVSYIVNHMLLLLHLAEHSSVHLLVESPLVNLQHSIVSQQSTILWHTRITHLFHMSPTIPAPFGIVCSSKLALRAAALSFSGLRL